MSIAEFDSDWAAVTSVEAICDVMAIVFSTAVPCVV